jgi:hydroxymethylpyrimidine pyrophosphatase-like HAD family hydrolase
MADRIFQEYMIIAVDFDNTLCESNWPHLGKPIMKTIDFCRQAKQAGHKLILNTCRCGRELEEALQFCSEHQLNFDCVNENLPEIIQLYGGDTRKISADRYIDDKNILPDQVDIIWNDISLPGLQENAR